MKKVAMESFEELWDPASVGNELPDKELEQNEVIPLIVALILLTIVEIFVYL